MTARVNEIRDGWVRLVGIPGFGLTIPFLTGLMNGTSPRQAAFWAGLAWFVGLSGAIWQGNRWLLFKQRERLDWLDRPVWKVVTLLVGVVCYTAPLTVVWLGLWYRFAALGPAPRDVVLTVVLINVICVVFVSHVYETVFLIKARESDLLRFERLERSRAQAELAALESQMDPHFLFNSLNTLAALIDTDPAKARAFNEGLANTYRYILGSRDRRLVTLREELEFARRYFSLLSLRFGDAVTLTVRGEETALGAQRVPPMSVQLLIENAVKHNRFDHDEPLEVVVTLDRAAVVVANARREKELARPGARVGLSNLSERYRLLGHELRIDASAAEFRVTLPTVEAA